MAKKSPEENSAAENTPKTSENTPKTAETAPKKKVYKFVSENKSLTCAALGIQFVDGKAETDSLGIAKILNTLSGVTRVED